MGKSYEERMSEKYNFLKHKDESDVTNEELDNTTSDNTSGCLLYTSPSPRDVEESRMPSSA